MRTSAPTRTRPRTTTLTVLVVLTVLFGGFAAAFWRAGGGGTATAANGTTVPVTLSPGSPSTHLYPGGQANVVLTITNPNASSVRVGSLALDSGQGTGGFGVDGAHSGCGLSTLSFATQTNGGAGWTVPGNDSLPVTLTNPLSMTSAAANACQGATFTVYLVAS